MFAITGATGHLGQATITNLLPKVSAQEIVALVRDPQKATDLSQHGVLVRQGSYDDIASLVAAFQGVDTVLLISTSETDYAIRMQQHQNVIDAARQVGVRHLIYTSVLNPSRDSAFSASPSHLATEDYLVASGLTYTVFRNTLYADIVPGLVGQEVLSSGKFYLAAGDGRVSYAVREDIAKALANVLTTTGHDNKIYDIAPSPAYSMHEVATAISEVTDQPVEYVPISGETMAAGMRQQQVPEAMITLMGGIVKAMNDNELDSSSTDLEQLLGHKPTDLKMYLSSVYR